VLACLRNHVLSLELFKEFCDTFIAEVNRSRLNASANRASAEAELGKLNCSLRRIVDALAEGVPARTLKDELLDLETREDVLTTKLAATPEQTVLLTLPR
jgi:site-specific DNA recombinase